MRTGAAQLDEAYRARLFARFDTGYRAGIPVRELVGILARGEPARTRRGLDTFARQLERGRGIAEAGRSSGVFLPWEAALLAAAEQAGSLEAVCRRLSEDYAVRDRQRRRLRNRMLYPWVVLVIGLLVLPLPALFRGDIGPNGYLLRALLPPVLLVAGLRGLRAGWRRLRAGASGLPIDLAVLPLLGRQLRRDLLAVLTLALRAGLPALEALALARDASASPRLRGRMVAAIGQVEHGLPVSQALARAGLFDDPAAQGLVATGEQAGRLEEMLEYHLGQLDRRLQERLDTLADWLPRLVYVLILAVLLLGWLA
ncbi:MAG: type II secretion system F family protein [Candidatus Competibacterales bacterium]|nr:type II secretion system F family protein [Candidatus Competibacterales bacterium]